MTSSTAPDQNYFPDDFGPMIETAQVAGMTLIANALIAFDRLRRDPRMRHAAEAIPPSAQAMLADEFDIHSRGYKPKIFGEDDERVGPPVTQGQCLQIAAALRAQFTPAATRKDGEPVAWRIMCTTNGATGHLYTEVLPFDPGSGVRVRREPEPLYAAPPVVAPEPVGDGAKISHVDNGDDERCPLCRANDDIAYYRDALERITEHKPETPGLNYESVNQLLESAVGIARITLDLPALVEQRRKDIRRHVGGASKP